MDLKHIYKTETAPSFDEYERPLHVAAIRLRNLYLVIDALNDFTGDARYSLLLALEILGPKLRLLLTLRHTFEEYCNADIGTSLEIRAEGEYLRQYLN